MTDSTDKGLGAQLRPLGESFDGFKMLREHFNPALRQEPMTPSDAGSATSDGLAASIAENACLLKGLPVDEQSEVFRVARWAAIQMHAALSASAAEGEALRLVRDEMQECIEGWRSEGGCFSEAVTVVERWFAALTSPDGGRK
jgi:hypothetical protein